jgi:hypothetical protein
MRQGHHRALVVPDVELADVARGKPRVTFRLHKHAPLFQRLNWFT